MHTWLQFQDLFEDGDQEVGAVRRPNLDANGVVGIDCFTCGHNVVIRTECKIGDRVGILHGCTLEGRLKISKGVKIIAHVYLPSGTTISSMVFIGPDTTFLNARFPTRMGGIEGATLGNNVVIGGGVTIGPGVTIGENVFVGAGKTVLSDITANSLVYGTPARHQPMPEKYGCRNMPEMIFQGLDLWDNTHADGTWREEDFPGRAEWLIEKELAK